MKKILSILVLFFLISLQSLSPAITEAPATEELRLSAQELRRKKNLIGLAAAASSLEIGTSTYFLCGQDTLSLPEKKLYFIRIAKGLFTLMRLHGFYKSDEPLPLDYPLRALNACASLVSCGLELTLPRSNNPALIACFSSAFSLLNTEIMFPEKRQIGINNLFKGLCFFIETAHEVGQNTPPRPANQNNEAAHQAQQVHHNVRFQDIFNRQSTASLATFAPTLQRLLPAAQIIETTEKKCSVCWEDPAEKIVFLNKNQEGAPIQPICAECLLRLYNNRNYNNPYTNLPLQQTIAQWTYHQT